MYLILYHNLQLINEHCCQSLPFVRLILRYTTSQKFLDCKILTFFFFVVVFLHFLHSKCSNIVKCFCCLKQLFSI